MHTLINIYYGMTTINKFLFFKILKLVIPLFLNPMFILFKNIFSKFYFQIVII